MAKSVIKEIIIVLLLCLAIMLVLGILLYEYVPVNKTIPNEVAYTTPQNVKKELASSSDVDDSQIIMTYEINSDDLSNYRRVQDYVPGKANPFSSYETAAENPTESNSSTGGTSSSGSSSTGNSSTGSSSSGSTSTSGSSSSTNNNSTTSTDDDSSSGGHFFQNTGTK